jgi:hypothetical protein
MVLENCQNHLAPLSTGLHLAKGSVEGVFQYWHHFPALDCLSQSSNLKSVFLVVQNATCLEFAQYIQRAQPELLWRNRCADMQTGQRTAQAEHTELVLSGKCNDPGSARELTHLNPSRL